ncbi:MAG: hypothetical protein V4493_01375 [Pseudomonadota bacterium]
MTITTLAVDDPITADKINEVIDAINAISFSWVNFNGVSGVAIRASFGNISGVTRISSGAYRIGFSTEKANANYMTVGSCYPTNGNDTGFVVIAFQGTTHMDIHCRNDDGGLNDSPIICLTIIGG